MRTCLKAVLFGAALATVSGAAMAETIQLRLTVPTICVAKPVAGGSSQLEVKTFCNAPRGGTVFVVASTEGAPTRLRIDGQSVLLEAGERRAIFASEGPFRNTLTLGTQGGSGTGGQVSLLFQAVPNA